MAGRTYALLFGQARSGRELAAEMAILEATAAVDEVYLYVSDDESSVNAEPVSTDGASKVVAVSPSGATRDLTIGRALTALRGSVAGDDLVLIIESGQPRLSEATVNACLSLAAREGAAIVASMVRGDVLGVSEAGKVSGLPPEDLTFVATGLLATQFERIDDLFDWATRIAPESIESAYRWALPRLKPVALVWDGDELIPAATVIRDFLELR